MRKQFELSESELRELHEAAKPVPYMVIGGVEPVPPRDAVNRIWERLGSEKGFKWDTAKPIAGMPEKFFTAEVTEAVVG